MPLGALPLSFWTIHWFIGTPCSVASSARRACKLRRGSHQESPAVVAPRQRFGNFVAAGAQDLHMLGDGVLDGGHRLGRGGRLAPQVRQFDAYA
ncbi:hypothetical protein A9X03_16025 [Mycobacterium sp. E1715]|nr:hypothetical protein A9X03_16025 [Mycobacterium sp. E1715]